LQAWKNPPSGRTVEKKQLSSVPGNDPRGGAHLQIKDKKIGPVLKTGPIETTGY
jgi:hypothetical protein